MREPSIMDTMKLEKIYPNGSWSSVRSRRAGTHKKTKRYIDPSKQVWVKTSVRRELSSETE